MPLPIKTRLVGFWIALVAMAAASGVRAAPPDFADQVLPLLKTKCWKCHGGEKTEGNLDLRFLAGLFIGGDSGPAIVPGRPEKSLLWRRVADGEMPPEDSLIDPLRPQERDTIRRVCFAWRTTT